MSGGISDPRNTAIFKMFVMLNIGERAGSGLANLQYVWREHHMKMPVIEENFSPDQTILVVPLVKEYSETGAVNNDKSAVNTRIGALNNEQSAVNENIGAVNKEDNQTLILNFIKKKETITSSELAQYLGCGQAWARKLLSKLIEQNLIDYQGTYRNRTYRLKNPRQDV